MTDDNIYYILLTGGFGDNLKLYCFKYAHPEYNVVFVNVANVPELRDNIVIPQYYDQTLQNNKMEVGQKNTNMSLFNFPDVINYIPKGQKLYINKVKINGNSILQFDISKYKEQLQPYLLSPKVPYSKTCIDIFNEVSSKRYGLIGIRWKYPCIGTCGSYFFRSSDKFVPKFAKFLEKHDNIILMFDDWDMIPMFEQMFIDILKGKRIISLQNIPINNIHELLKIASAVRRGDFVHNYSGFYQVVSLVLKDDEDDYY